MSALDWALLDLSERRVRRQLEASAAAVAVAVAEVLGELAQAGNTASSLGLSCAVPSVQAPRGTWS